MKAQATIEFMLTFLVVIAFFSILLAAILAANAMAKSQISVMTEETRMKCFMRLVEVYTNSGIAMAGKTDMIYRIENNEVRIEYMNKTMVVAGIVNAGKAHGEPV